MKLNKLPLALAAAGLLFASCQKEDVSTDTQEILNNKAPAQEKVSKEVINKVEDLNFNSDYVESFELTLPGGDTKTSYL